MSATATDLERVRRDTDEALTHLRRWGDFNSGTENDLLDAYMTVEALLRAVSTLALVVERGQRP